MGFLHQLVTAATATVEQRVPNTERPVVAEEVETTILPTGPDVLAAEPEVVVGAPRSDVPAQPSSARTEPFDQSAETLAPSFGSGFAGPPPAPVPARAAPEPAPAVPEWTLPPEPRSPLDLPAAEGSPSAVRAPSPGLPRTDPSVPLRYAGIRSVVQQGRHVAPAASAADAGSVSGATDTPREWTELAQRLLTTHPPPVEASGDTGKAEHSAASGSPVAAEREVTEIRIDHLDVEVVGGAPGTEQPAQRSRERAVRAGAWDTARRHYLGGR